jgi:hypothetical protein
MIKDKKLVVSTFAGIMLLVGGNVFAAQPAGVPPNTGVPPNNCAPDCVRQNVPEIDASSGGTAIALLVTAMLLAAERTRRI